MLNTMLQGTNAKQGRKTCCLDACAGRLGNEIQSIVHRGNKHGAQGVGDGDRVRAGELVGVMVGVVDNNQGCIGEW